MPRYTYLIQRADTGRRMSTGVVTASSSPYPTTAQLAADLVAQNRIEHSYYAGGRTCWIWPYDSEQALAHMDTAPAEAERYDYPASAPAREAVIARTFFADDLELSLTGGCPACGLEHDQMCVACGRCNCDTHASCVRPT
ncbi:hypothetical protein ACIBJC_15215 [Streptomyces sp. NPDC050509]|uniref:hypothetical protein n=1 Tax=Streptomyces sp. NPDC050509 TaxID=3365620 RepID=UPI0037B1DCA7